MMSATIDDIVAELNNSELPARGINYSIWKIATAAWPNSDTGQVLVLGPYTTSIDAIKNLAERCLPGWGWRIGTCSVSDDAWLFPDLNHPILGQSLAKRYAHLRDPIEWFLEKTDVDLRPPGRQALAMCISFLLAIKYLDGTEDEDSRGLLAGRT